MSKRKKPRLVETAEPVETEAQAAEVNGAQEREAQEREQLGAQEREERESVTTRTALPSDVLAQAMETARESDRAVVEEALEDVETTVNVSGDMLPFPGRDDLDAPTVAISAESLEDLDNVVNQRKHLRGLLEALIFASDAPIKPQDLAKLASAPLKQVKDLLVEIKQEFQNHGFHLEELASGWVFRTSAQYAPFVRDLTKQKPVRLSRAQVETLAIIAYRQPITRPEIDDVRGVDSGPVLKVLLERDLVRILGKRDEVGRPLIYGTTTHFLEFFGLKSLKDLPTLREFTELTDESREAYEAEMGEPPVDVPLGEEGADPGTETTPEADAEAPEADAEAPGTDAASLDGEHDGEARDAASDDATEDAGRPPYETAPDGVMDDRTDIRDSMAVPAGTHGADDEPPPSRGTDVMVPPHDDATIIADADDLSRQHGEEAGDGEE